MNDELMEEFVNRIIVLERRVDNLETAEDDTTAWTEYSDTSTITGWSSYDWKEIYYKKIGSVLLVAFYIDGTSDSATTTFTTPYTCTNDPSTVNIFSNTIPVRDNGSWAMGWVYAARNSTTVGFGPSAGSTTWTASGQKTIRGFIVFQVQ